MPIMQVDGGHAQIEAHHTASEAEQQEGDECHPEAYIQGEGGRVSGAGRSINAHARARDKGASGAG